MVESTRKSLLGDESPRKSANQEVKWVSKVQYDELVEKYKTLQNDYENLKDNKSPISSSVDQVDILTDTNTETIDVFGKDGTATSESISTKPLNTDKVSTDLEYYQKALALLENSKTDEALKIFQFMEKSEIKQIQVRSKKYIGDIYLSKNQFDLALQVYEGIIRTSSYSAIVIEALRKASFCSTKLGLNDKKAQYESMLKDFFEVRV